MYWAAFRIMTYWWSVFVTYVSILDLWNLTDGIFNPLCTGLTKMHHVDKKHTTVGLYFDPDTTGNYIFLSLLHVKCFLALFHCLTPWCWICCMKTKLFHMWWNLIGAMITSLAECMHACLLNLEKFFQLYPANELL